MGVVDDNVGMQALLAERDAQGPQHVETTGARQENLTELAARTPVHPPSDITRDRRGKRSTGHVDDIDIGDSKGGVLRGFCNPGCLAGTRNPYEDADWLISPPRWPGQDGKRCGKGERVA